MLVYHCTAIPLYCYTAMPSCCYAAYFVLRYSHEEAPKPQALGPGLGASGWELKGTGIGLWLKRNRPLFRIPASLITTQVIQCMLHVGARCSVQCKGHAPPPQHPLHAYPAGGAGGAGGEDLVSGCLSRLRFCYTRSMSKPSASPCASSRTSRQNSQSQVQVHTSPRSIPSSCHFLHTVDP